MENREQIEFKREFHFRNCADRSCLNCKRSDQISSRSGRAVCRFSMDDPSLCFPVCQFTVCDSWERRTEPPKSPWRGAGKEGTEGNSAP